MALVCDAMSCINITTLQLHAVMLQKDTYNAAIILTNIDAGALSGMHIQDQMKGGRGLSVESTAVAQALPMTPYALPKSYRS